MRTKIKRWGPPTSQSSIAHKAGGTEFALPLFRRISGVASWMFSPGPQHCLPDDGQLLINAETGQVAQCPVTRLSRNLLISPFKSRNRPGQVPGTSDASKTQSGLIRSYAAPLLICWAVATFGAEAKNWVHLLSGVKWPASWRRPLWA